jgi:hypothetical protein
MNGRSTPVAHPTLCTSNVDENEDDIDGPLLSDDRHERTGSVKFADQADEGKEVSAVDMSSFCVHRSVTSRVHYNVTIRHIRKI